MTRSAGQILRAGTVLGLFAAVAAGVLAGTYALTADRIRESEQHRLLEQLQQVLPQGAYDNDIAADALVLDAPALTAGGPMTVYRARRAGAPVAAVLSVATPDGYSGPIAVLVGITQEGRISGVRVLAHRETPGLGDKIDIERNDWILDFNGRSLSEPNARGWAVRKDGGVFDQFAGATITPRAVVKLVYRTLQYFEQNREALFAPAAGQP